MKLLLAAVLWGSLLAVSTADSNQTETSEADQLKQVVVELETKLTEMQDLKDNLEGMKNQFQNLARQVMLQQFNAEHRIRTSGQSGIKTTRGTTLGPLNYQTTNHINNRFLAIHDHSNHVVTVGMGELNAVINGIEFSTRHNDYLLHMPDSSSNKYHATKEIPWPEVPPSVLEFTDVDDQSKEMAEYFRAFATQNKTHRDYDKYFKPIMCYMEGAWTLDKDLTEPFESDRHHLAASSWMELQNLIRFNAYTGVKNIDENLAHLPTKIIDVDEDGNPTYAQWNYRILCNPIEEEMPLNYFIQLTDLKYTYLEDRVFDDTRNERNARFTLDESRGNFRTKRHGLLDRIFNSIPGKDNRPTDLSIEGYDRDLYVPGTGKTVKQDTSMYARATEFGGKDAMGSSYMLRGWNEMNMWCAQTTQPRVAPIVLDTCNTKKNANKQAKGQEIDDSDCAKYYNRFSWAIPMEVIYMTPLLNWNPYNIELRSIKMEYLVRKGGRKGLTKEDALNGTKSKDFYRTPMQFYDGGVPYIDGADTAKDSMWVLDSAGEPRYVAPSGSRIVTMHIRDDVGFVRLRYPIAPIADEGNGGWMETNALRDWVMDRMVYDKYSNIFIRFNMSSSRIMPPAIHSHVVTISAYDAKYMMTHDKMVTVTTSESEGHTHKLECRYKDGKFRYSKCHDRAKMYNCADEHGRRLFPWPEDIVGLDFFPQD